MSTSIVADLVKALEEARHEAFEELHPDLLKRINAAIARAKQLDLDRAEVKFFYSSLRDLTHCTILFDNDVEVLCIPLRPTPRDTP